jgi:hypothetical protein
MGFVVAGNIITATWSFAPAEAPAEFTVVVTEQGDERERPAALAAPIRLVRRDGAVIEWEATITLADAVADRSLAIRATGAAPIRVGEVTRGTRGPMEAPTPSEELEDLQTLLGQQPDGGREILSRIMPSANPDEVLADLDAEVERAIDARDSRAVWPFTFIGKPKLDEAKLAAFCDTYRIAPISKDDAADRHFQTKEDWQRYASAAGAVAFHTGGEVDSPLSLEVDDAARDLTYDVRDGEVVDGSIEVALFADNGNGLHTSRAIANQIVRSGLPYAFHLGDVYYGGTEQQFENYFYGPLSPMLGTTELFMLTGNHEMYARGEFFNRMIRRKAADNPDRQRQAAEMYRLRGPGFQIIGLDTMFVGWNAGQPRVHDYLDEQRLEVLRTWLDDRPNDLTVVLTSNEAWDKGSHKTTRLYQSLRATIAGRVDFWFWGNVHYAALFDMWPFADTGNPLRRMVTSCIGHGGYPFYTEKSVGALPGGLACRWLETKSRFWPDTSLRGDVGLNGWCRMKITRGADDWEVLLTYVDWVGRERVRARLGRKDAGGIYFKSVEESELASVGAPMTWRKVELGSVT